MQLTTRSFETAPVLAAPPERLKVRSLRIVTLGCCEIAIDGRPIPDEAWSGPHPKRLLLILVSFGQGSVVPRDEVLDLLCSSEDRDRQSTDLYDIFRQVQAVLGRPVDRGTAFLRLQGGRIGLNPEYCRVDCWAFEETVSKARRYEVYGQQDDARRSLDEARALYRGPFLPGVRERWAEAKRYSLQRRRLWIDETDKRR